MISRRRFGERGAVSIVKRVGGTVTAEPYPRLVLDDFARVTDDDEFGDWMHDYRAGRWILVRLGLFADSYGNGGDHRHNGPTVRGLSFALPHGEQNVAHARDMVASYVSGLVEVLRRDGIPTDPEALGLLPIAIELDAAMAARLAV